MGQTYEGADNRKYLRVFKNYSLLFSFRDLPDQKSDGTFIKDISKGGVRFTTSKPIKVGTILILEISIPYIAPKKLFLEGLVISSKEVTPHLLYEIRAQFDKLDGPTLEIFDMVEKRNKGL